MYRRSNRRAAAPRGGFRRRSFGPRLRVAKEPQRWEVGQFFFGNIINITDQATNPSTIVTSLAQLDHLGDTTSPQGRTLNNAARWLEIGGVVFRYEILSSLQDLNLAGIPSNTTEFVNRIAWRVLLVSDRLDAVGAPNSIPNWFNVTPPVIAAQSTAAEDIDSEYPTRIHWQNFHTTTWANRDGTGVAAQSVRMDNRRGGANLRLRLRLDDSHGLFIHFAQSHSSPSEDTATFVGQLLMTGTIYYRWRF